MAETAKSIRDWTGKWPVLVVWALIVAVMLIAGLFVDSGSPQALSSKYFQAISRDALKEIRNLLAPSEIVLQECTTKARRGLIPVDNPQELGFYLAERLRYQKGLKWLSYSDAKTGRFTGARRDNDQIIVNRSDPLVNDGRASEEIVKDNGDAVPLHLPKPAGYDPRNGDWYKAAMANPGITWTKPFKFYEGEFGITAANAFRMTPADKPKGVFTADFYLKEIAHFLDGLTDGNQNFLYVLDRDGSEIAVPLSQKPENAEPVLRQVLSKLPAIGTLNVDKPVQIMIDGSERYVASIQVFQATEHLQWVNAIVVPERILLVDSHDWGKRLRFSALALSVPFVVLLILTWMRKPNPVVVQETRLNLADSTIVAPSGRVRPEPLMQDDTVVPVTNPARGHETTLKFSIKEASSHLKAPVTISDLSSDRLLAMTPRIDVDGKEIPSVGGIPLLNKLGQGGMGAVYYGIHPKLHKEVAVKVLSFVLAESEPEWVQRFHREGQLAARINSPYLVNVFDAGEEKGLFYLVMEFVRGISAGEYIERIVEAGSVGLPEKDALEICCAATKGLAAAHTQGIIHRDIKPDNIMLPCNDGSKVLFDSAKLTDLGLARAETSGSLTAPQSLMGTAGFMAPEQVQDSRRAGKAADVFAMGATLYVFLTGAIPFEGTSTMDTLMKTMGTKHIPIRKSRTDVSEKTAEVIDRCLMKDPEQRFRDATELLRALQDCYRRFDSPKVSVRSFFGPI